MTPDELHETLTGRGTFEDHDEVVRVVRPVQDGEGNLFWKGVWMIRLEDRQIL